MATKLILSMEDAAGNIRDTVDTSAMADGNTDITSGPIYISAAKVLADAPIPPMFSVMFKAMFDGVYIKLELTPDA